MPSVVTRAGGLRTFNAAQRRSLRLSRERGEAHTVRNIGHRIAVGVDLELVQGIGCEGSNMVGPRGSKLTEGCTFRIRIDLCASPGLGKANRSVKSSLASPCGKPNCGPV
jgi:hypothetical protein